MNAPTARIRLRQRDIWWSMSGYIQVSVLINARNVVKRSDDALLTKSTCELTPRKSLLFAATVKKASRNQET